MFTNNLRFTYQSSASHFATKCIVQPVCVEKGLNYIAGGTTKLASCTACPASRYTVLQNHRNTAACVAQPTCGKGLRISADTNTAGYAKWF
jgi:hypothetical protein